MKLLSLTLFFLSFTACNSSVTKLLDDSDISEECWDTYSFFLKNLKKNDSNYYDLVNYDTEYRWALEDSYMNNIQCWLSQMTVETAVNLFGEPNELTVLAGTSNSIYIYYIHNSDCPGIENASLAQIKCGMLQFEFDNDGNQVSGFFTINE